MRMEGILNPAAIRAKDGQLYRFARALPQAVQVADRTGEGGNLLSPVSTVTAETGMSSRSAAVWATTVRTPVPISWAAISTCALPVASNCTRAVAAPRCVG